MDCENKDSELRKFGSSRTSSASSSLRRRSLSLSLSLPKHLNDDDDENESVSEAGDIGDRELQSNRYSGSGRLRLIGENAPEHVVVVPISEDTSSVTPVFPIKLISQPDHKKNDEKTEVPWVLEYTSCLLFLAVFGILGVLLRYGLQKLFGPGIVGATSDHSYMYLDLPSNMVGSFLMGWFGVVFKEDISRISSQLAIGLSTGFLGSLTTFSGWNQKMLELSVEGQWVFVVLGYLLGLFLVAYSIIFGIETAKGANWLYRRANMDSSNSGTDCHWRVDSCKRHLIVILILLLILASLWGMSIGLEVNEFSSGSPKAQLWLACIVGPFGVWIRWFLARLNGRGLGKSGLLKWVPFGTLIANVSAACIMAAFATLKKAVNTETCDTVASGIQFGLLGCLSTVSTFIAEFHAMRGSKYPWRAYVYALCTTLISFVLGTLIYSVPVWVENFN
ncbi:fluoride export protein 1 [Solanum stenotomum]|uniref:fluoride export protein 1 n=1 Tax=Solanum stenotomum TaxID=172797 RepID=UPI0020D17C9A|nr:fluoride export protein 1 [Solanum stenotomum]XP_049380222.1 fluoride export protein 1 [Solanum stenotomum]